MSRFPRTRRALTLAEVLVAAAVMALTATIALGAWVRTNESATLTQAQQQVAAVLRDAIARVSKPCTGQVPNGQCGSPFAYNQVKVCFTTGSGILSEQAAYGASGASFQAVTPPSGISLTLPAGITVQSTTLSAGCMTAQMAETDTSVWEQFGGETTSGVVTLTSTHGMTVTVSVGTAGDVSY